jgi:hypothetical protein
LENVLARRLEYRHYLETTAMIGWIALDKLVDAQVADCAGGIPKEGQ